MIVSTTNNDILEVVVAHNNGVTGEQVNRFMFKATNVTTYDDADILDDVGDFIETLYNLVKTFISVRNVLRDVFVRNVTQDYNLGYVDPPTYSGGTAADPQAPEGVAPYIYFQTAVPNVTLSKYLPCSNTGNIFNDGGPSAGFQTALGNFGASLLAGHTGTKCNLQFGHKLPIAGTWVVPDTVVVPGFFAYQRRRKRNRGS